MHILKDDVPVKIDTPIAIARQLENFGDATGYGKMGAEYFTLNEGADIAPLLKGLVDDLCHAPHWGYLIKGALTVTYKDGKDENINTGDMFFWPPGHTVKADESSEFVLFSPQKEHSAVMDHINSNLSA